MAVVGLIFRRVTTFGSGATCGLALILAFGLAFGAVPALASDFHHACRSADGSFVMQDEVLTTADAAPTGPSKPITYETRETIVLDRREGYCVDKRFQDKKYGFSSKVYVLRIAFRHEGAPLAVNMLCELATSGLPASRNCDREVVTLAWQLKPGAQPETRGQQGSGQGGPATDGREQDRAGGGAAASVWWHNGSGMRLVADGARRMFVYDTPRQGLQARGVSRGTVLFEGERRGASYVGRAYIFTARCGKVAYDVRGDVSRDERRVVMEGYAPTISQGCNRSGMRRDTLVFELAQ